MATPLKERFGQALPAQLAASLAAVYPAFDLPAFLADATPAYGELALMARGPHLARHLRTHLPADYEKALDILLASLGPGEAVADETADPDELDVLGQGLAPFFYHPHTCFVAAYGLDHPEASLRALHALTQRFTAEFSLRPFLEQQPQATLARLTEWTQDPSHHVRRAVSEATRPRLPWASRLRDFQRDPTPVLALLEKLKDDPSPYVRRSVANNLNDIGKDHPDLLLAIARRWLDGADPQRTRLLRHALRNRIKAGDAAVLTLFGYGQQARLELGDCRVEPAAPRIGEAVLLAATLHNPGRQTLNLLVDLRVHYVKANGRSSAKVFKLKTLTLAAGDQATVGKRLSLAEMSTRRHYPGVHAVELMINGQAYPLGNFQLQAEPA